VRIVTFHSSFTSSEEIDEIIRNMGSYKEEKRISKDELAGLHKVKIYFLVCFIKA